MYHQQTYDPYNFGKDSYYFVHPKQSWESHSTKTNTPNASEYGEDERESPVDCFSAFSVSPSQPKLHTFSADYYEDFEIDVKPKKKDFKSPEEKQRFVEEYSRKLKTEMCKNWETTGQCKFGDKCSFAHGVLELKSKNHLHSNYKTKPCKKFFLRGFCSYGIRCQYLHSDLLNRAEFREFAQKVYASKQLRLPPLIGTEQSEDEFWIQRFRRLKQNFKLKKWFVNDIISVTGNSSKRLPIFAELTSNQNNFN